MCEEVFRGFCSKNGFVRIFRQNFGYKNSPVLKNPGLWKKSLQKNVFFYPITTNFLTDAKERLGFRTPCPSATEREACKSKGPEW